MTELKRIKNYTSAPISSDATSWQEHMMNIESLLHFMQPVEAIMNRLIIPIFKLHETSAAVTS